MSGAEEREVYFSLELGSDIDQSGFWLYDERYIASCHHLANKRLISGCC
jgi:hypothetical protein